MRMTNIMLGLDWPGSVLHLMFHKFANFLQSEQQNNSLCIYWPILEFKERNPWPTKSQVQWRFWPAERENSSPIWTSSSSRESGWPLTWPWSSCWTCRPPGCLRPRWCPAWWPPERWEEWRTGTWVRASELAPGCCRWLAQQSPHRPPEEMSVSWHSVYVSLFPLKCHSQTKFHVLL